MAVEFVAGRAGENTDALILDRIKRSIKKDPLSSIIVLVPPQATYMTEKHIIRSIGLKGIMGISVMGPEKLTQRIMDSVYGRAKKIVDAPAKSMIVRILMEKHAADLLTLGSCIRAQNICGDIADIISEFKSLDITAEQLLEIRPEDENTARKCRDLAFLYQKFDEYLSEKALTMEDRMNIAIENVSNAAFIAESDVFVLHFDLFTMQMERFVAEIAKTAKNSVITFLDTDPGDADGELFDAVRKGSALLKNRIGGEVSVLRPQIKEVRGREAISHIEKNLYAYPFAVCADKSRQVEIVRADTLDQEVDAVAEAIASLVLEEGYSFGDIAVVCGNLSDYSDRIKKRFGEANIPFFLDDKRTACQNFIAGFLLSALDAAEGKLKKDKLLSHIEFAFGTDSPHVEVVKNYAFENVSNAYAFEKPFLEEEAEAARIECILPMLAFRKKMRGVASAKEKIGLLRAYMDEMLVLERAEAQIQVYAERTLFASGEYYEQAVKKIIEILDAAERILGDIAISASALSDILKSGFESAAVGLIPQGVDEVMVGDIRVSMLMDIKALFVLGANEGKMPDYEEKSDVLLQKERDFIFGEIAHISVCPLIMRQKLTIYQMFSLPSEKLVVSYSSNLDGAQAQPSVLIDRLCEILGIMETKAENRIGRLRENAVFIAAGEIRNLADGYTDKGHEMIAALMDREDTKDRILGYERFAARSNAAKRLFSGTAKPLFGGDVASATRYETFYACPFKHFVLYGLKPKILQECTLTSLDIGNYVHAVLDAFAKNLKQKDKTWGRISDEELKETLEESTAGTLGKELKYSVSPGNKNVICAVNKEIYFASAAIRSHFETSSLELAETELPFSLHIGGVVLKGKIDRIDLAKVGEQLYFKIVDYKTGEKEWFLEDFVEGLSLQLVTYLLAGMEYARQNFEDAKAAGADYFVVKLPLLEEYDREKLLAEFKMKGIEAVDLAAARALYGFDGKEIVSLKLRVKKDGEFHSTDKKDIFTQKEMEELMEYAKKLIHRALAEIATGKDDIAPVCNAKGQLPCSYCELKSICLYDDQKEVSKKQKLTREEIFARMREDAEKDHDV